MRILFCFITKFSTEIVNKLAGFWWSGMLWSDFTISTAGFTCRSQSKQASNSSQLNK